MTSMDDLRFRGPWTQEKLGIIRSYLDAYTTALKDRPFRLIYVDAFAGSGTWRSEFGYMSDDYGEFQEVHQGSASLALEVDDKPFDQLIFIEKDFDRSRSLERLKAENGHRNIEVRTGDANLELPDFCQSMGTIDRAVVFLDPYATQVKWSTVEAIASTQKIDCWILFPLMAIARLMPRDYVPKESWATRLDVVFGGREYWEDFYQPQRQLSLFGDTGVERPGSSDQIALRYQQRLREIFAMVAEGSRRLQNSNNAPLFELFFVSGNPRGAPIAVRIASHILNHL